MNTEYSKQFVRAVGSLSSSEREEIFSRIEEVKGKDSLKEVSECRKIASIPQAFRLQTHANRLLLKYFPDTNTAFFQLLLSSTEIHEKESELAQRRSEIIPLYQSRKEKFQHFFKPYLPFFKVLTKRFLRKA